MRISEFDYHLPPGLIAQTPLDQRSASRMLVVKRSPHAICDSAFAQLPTFLREGDLLVVNNTKVFPARLVGRSDTGARIEIFLVKEKSEDAWEALAKPARRLRPGKSVVFGSGLEGEILQKSDDGRVEIRFAGGSNIEQLIDLVGQTPLPPYIKREAAGSDADRERYQTVFARNRGAIAAPTAGLHFDAAMFERVRKIGVTVAEITLHVGYGTFEKVRAPELADHTVASETYEISGQAADLLNDAKTHHRRIVAVGTTTTRALESNLDQHARFLAGRFEAQITITPGYSFRAIDALLTNFHLPQSSLLVLTSTFGGHALIMEAYRHAVAERYRFYSYGDCMLIV